MARGNAVKHENIFVAKICDSESAQALFSAARDSQTTRASVVRVTHRFKKTLPYKPFPRT